MSKNMYPWINETRNFIGGECPHKCSYCYVKDFRFPALQKRYSGPPRLIENEFKKPLGKGKTIFVGSCFDMFAKDINPNWIAKIIDYCYKYPDNKYLFQSKNPTRLFYYWGHLYPPNIILGTTIETTEPYKLGNAPTPLERFQAMLRVRQEFKHPRMITIEPIMQFDLSVMIGWMQDIAPAWINIGADSKGHKLPEPPTKKIGALIKALRKFTEVRCKDNLKRLL